MKEGGRERERGRRAIVLDEAVGDVHDGDTALADTSRTHHYQTVHVTHLRCCRVDGISRWLVRSLLSPGATSS